MVLVWRCECDVNELYKVDGFVAVENFFLHIGVVLKRVNLICGAGVS